MCSAPCRVVVLWLDNRWSVASFRCSYETDASPTQGAFRRHFAVQALSLYHAVSCTGVAPIFCHYFQHNDVRN